MKKVTLSLLTMKNYIPLFIALLAGCNQPDTPTSLDQIYPIDVKEIINPPENAESWIEDIEFIPLETNDKAFLSTRMIYDINSNAILCCQKTTISIFNKDGQHLRSFSHVGKGPGEYGQIWEAFFVPNEELILISDKNTQKAVVYDYNGNYQHEFKIPFQWWKIIPLENQTIALYMSKALRTIPETEKKYQFPLMNYQGELIGGFMPYTFRMGAPYQIQLSKLEYEGSYAFAPSFQYNIYQFGPDIKLKKLYQFDLGNEGIDTTLINNPSFMKRGPTVKDFGDGLANLEHMALTTNNILFYTPKPHYKRMVMRLINRQSGNQRSLVMDSLFNAGYYQGFPIYLFPTRGLEDRFITSREAIDVKEFYDGLSEKQIKNLSKFKGFKQLAKLKEDDNPVLILYKLKDF